MTFTCTAIGVPAPNITWSNEVNGTIEATSNITMDTTTTTTSTLVLSNLTASYFNQSYTCTAFNVHNTSSISAILTEGSELVAQYCDNHNMYILYTVHDIQALLELTCINRILIRQISEPKYITLIRFSILVLIVSRKCQNTFYLVLTCVRALFSRYFMLCSMLFV